MLRLHILTEYDIIYHMKAKKCNDCGRNLNENNKTKRYNRCKKCERIRYRQVRIKKKEILVKDFLKNPKVRRLEGFNGKYLVSIEGDVFSVNETKIKRLRPGVNKSGYYVVCLFDNSKKSMKNVHRLVAQAFIPNKYPYIKKIINHKDGNKLNNNVGNLEWCTYKQNVAHALRTGLQPKGEQIASAKLTEKDILEIYQQKDRISQKELSNIYDVTIKVISLIQKRKVWKHVKRYQAKPKRKFLLNRGKNEIDINYLDKEITWRKPKYPDFAYATILDGDKLFLYINDFPDEPLYTLYVNDKKIIDIDDLPETWTFINVCQK